ncbi:unnamed protein product, partial [Gulo gulo]
MRLFPAPLILILVMRFAWANGKFMNVMEQTSCLLHE